MMACYVLEIMYYDEEMYFAPTEQDGLSGRYMCDSCYLVGNLSITPKTLA